MKRSDFMLGGRDFKDITAGQMMETNIARVEEGTTFREAARIMTDHDITSLPVIDSKHGLMGLITEYDVLHPMSEGKDLNSLTAGDILTKDVQVVSESTPAINILNLFDQKRVFKVFVVENEILKGVIAKHDVVLAYLNATEDAPKGF